MKSLPFILLSIGSLGAETLSWDPLPANCGVVGYDIYYGPNAALPSNHVQVGKVTTIEIDAIGTNYYTVTGRNAAGKNSKPSNQVMWPEAIAPTPTPTPSPTATPTPPPTPTPVPSPHTHTWDEITDKPATFPNAPHAHPIPGSQTGTGQ